MNNEEIIKCQNCDWEGVYDDCEHRSENSYELSCPRCLKVLENWIRNEK